MKFIFKWGIRILTVLYISFIVYGSLFPFQISPHHRDLLTILKNLFTSLTATHMEKKDTIGNFGFYAPLGFLIALWGDRNRFSVTRIFTLCVLSGMFLSFLIEIGQAYLTVRYSSATDIILNTLGTATGGFIVLAFMAITASPISIPQKPLSPSNSLNFLSGWFILIIYIALIGAYMLSPFRFDFSWPYAQSRFSLEMFLPFYDYWDQLDSTAYPIQDVIFTLFVYAPLGGLLYYSLRNLKPAFILVILFCFAFSFGIETLQLFMPQRTPEITDVIVAASGGVIGAWVIQRFIEFH